MLTVPVRQKRHTLLEFSGVQVGQQMREKGASKRSTKV